tara:strand:- start:71 stop:367 length:297 start_codon:yes stop_codon:yes gene_type:complete
MDTYDWLIRLVEGSQLITNNTRTQEGDIHGNNGPSAIRQAKARGVPFWGRESERQVTKNKNRHGQIIETKNQKKSWTKSKKMSLLVAEVNLKRKIRRT